MKSLILPLLYSALVVALVTSNRSSCEQLSTVFVLETSDSSPDSHSSSNGGESSSSVAKNIRKPDTDSNTRIITDGSLTNVPHAINYKNQKPNPEIESVTNQGNSPKQSDIAHQSNSQVTNAQSVTNHNENKARDLPVSRRLEEESQPVSSNRLKLSSAVRSNQQSKPRSTGTPSPNPREETPTTTRDVPKVEERLLISITSDDDDYKPPQKQHIVPSSGSINDELQPVNSQHNHQKRKPSITISIQDNSAGKQIGESGSPGAAAVIVRPSENGQSIVISTVGGSSSHNNKQNQNSIGQKPSAIAIVTSPSNNNNNESPYREPINIPIQSGQHHISSTTYKPLLVNDYNPSSSTNNNRPISSTLIEQARPPIQLSEERPHRPVDTSYEIQRPTSRPVTRPTQDPTAYGSDSEEESMRPSNLNQQSEPKYPLSEKNCGLMHETRIVGGDEADPSDFLWMAAIIKSKPKDGDVRPFCGGSLITRRHILTAAHCLENLAPRDVLVRLGSYDFDDSTASSLSADYAIDQFRVPALYSKKTHTADIAIMRLKTPIAPTDNYKTVCMPQARRSYVGALGTVTGYGSQSQTFRRAAPKLRQVTVPIWENRKCSVVYKKNLTDSFLCAGYEEGGKDACQGDSGGPLMTEGPNERMMIVGVVSHGIGCGSPGYPGVYTRTTTYLDWIEKNTRE